MNLYICTHLSWSSWYVWKEHATYISVLYFLYNFKRIILCMWVMYFLILINIYTVHGYLTQYKAMYKSRTNHSKSNQGLCQYGFAATNYIHVIARCTWTGYQCTHCHHWELIRYMDHYTSGNVEAVKSKFILHSILNSGWQAVWTPDSMSRNRIWI